MLGWLCILAKHLGTHAKASLPCLLLPLHRILPFPQQLQKDNNPSKIAITLASLVKGRWIDGKAQTVALLRFNCDIHALFITKPFCRQDGGIATSPRFAPHSYRPLSKVRCCRRKNSGDYRRDCHTYRTLSVSLTPPLTIPHSAPNPRKTAPSLRLALYPCLPSKKGRWLDGIAKPLFYIIFIL